jgi:hypothetical protein
MSNPDIRGSSSVKENQRVVYDLEIKWLSWNF